VPRFGLTKKDTGFYDLLERITGNLVDASDLLVDLFENYENVAEKARKLKDFEHEGDAMTHEIIRRVHRTFVTPIDREDITLLAHSLDEVMDFIEAAGRMMNLYRIDQPTDRARQLAGIVARVAHKLNEAMPRLRRGDQYPWILKQCVQINSMENEADDAKNAALAELFDSCYTDACYVIKWREIYEHLETATDRGEDVANVLEGIVLKHA